MRTAILAVRQISSRELERLADDMVSTPVSPRRDPMNEPKKTKPTPEQQAVLDKIAKMPEKDRTRLLKLERLRRGLPTRR